ncbi:GATA zinc finger [Colletotrichum tofieldiae]|uniref:GATA zinc finger n=1 Tax=Colletotrichum tofieldiae TaxID=708197 RepID=A0A166QRZ2_9PEZI|nr:GATA zinc finger [Colletotrichum tofieldiae]GKT63136.1 GATA zinc finger [Colletotrichum tofieldiae]GKT72850.1 GATA zinc finger [Colletotrichum tofieldiae]GKT89304.1 GATA zinc finger [Colletotrichum tofieldiae]
MDNKTQVLRRGCRGITSGKAKAISAAHAVFPIPVSKHPPWIAQIRHGAKQLLRLTENYPGYNGSGPAGGYETINEHALPSDNDLRAMSRLSNSIARDISEIRALRKDDPNAHKRRVGESSQQQAAFRNDAPDRGAQSGRRPRRKVEFSCHKCHRVDTPEWRPGPDGPSTLCNVCGLIYAKRERKKEESTMPTFGSPKLS